MNDKLESIVALVQGNRLMEARKACAAYLRKNKTDADAWFVNAGIHSCFNDLEQVINSCKRALSLQPEHAPAAFNLGVALQARRRLPEAVEAYRACLTRDTSNQAAKLNMAIACNELCIEQLNSGNYPAAEAFAREALAIQPNLPDTYNNLGLVANAQRDPEEAEQYLKTALRLRPDYPQALNNLGSLYVLLGRPSEAITYFKKATSADPHYADAYNNMGLAYQKFKEKEKSLDAFTNAIRENPHNPEYHNNIGNTWLSLGDPEKALQHFRKAVELRPAFPEALTNLGNALLMTENHRERYDEAERHYRKAIELKPDMAEAYFNLGTCLHPQARFEEALVYYEKAISLKPDYDDAVSGKSSIMEHLGRFDDAFRAVQPLVEKGTTNINVALAFGKLAKKFDRVTQAITLLENIIDNKLDSRNLGEAHFLLGKLYDEIGQHDRAFSHYLRANSIDAPLYNHNETVRIHERLMSVFNRKRQAVAVRASNRSRLPVFIVGMPRSGTSLVEQVLASHPQVFGAGELEDIGNLATTIGGRIGTHMPYPECADIANQDVLDAMANGYLEKLKTLGGTAQRVTDKMPHNFQALGLIERLFPGAHVIHCVRDPIDTCLSIYFQHFNAHHAYSCDLRSLGRYYQQYLKLMSHWKENLSLPIYEVRYESMVEELEHISRGLIEFIGLDWDASCLQFHKSDRIVATPSYDQVRQPIYRKSVKRWKSYEQHLGELISALDSADGTIGRDEHAIRE
jgi:tetratricopeptide (TPR) repeat protein